MFVVLSDDYFIKSPLKTDIINNMLDYYLKHIYQKTDYLSNIHAKDFRRIYNKNNFKEEDKYITWFKLYNHPF